MDILIDGEPLATERETYTSILDAARRYAATRGRLVVGIDVDGRRLGDDEIDRLGDSPTGPTTKVRLTTEDATALVRCALIDAAELLRSTDGPRDAAVRHVRNAHLADALRDIETVSRQWQHVRTTVEQAAEVLGVSVTELLTSSTGGGKTPVAETLGLCLTELARCVRDSDWSGLGDVLAYDLADQTAEWFERLMSAAGRLERAASPARRVA